MQQNDWKQILKTVIAAAFVAITCVIISKPVQAEEIPGVMTVDLVLFAGQSNMAGTGGNARLAPAVPNGCGYEFLPAADPSGLHSLVEPFGKMESGYLADPSSLRKGTLVSSFVNSYYAATGVPVVAVSAVRGATDSAYWASPQAKSDLLYRYTLAKSYLTSNHITLRRSFAVWLQGESDAIEGTTGTQYQTNVTSAFGPLFASGLERVYVITPGHPKGNAAMFDPIINAQVELCAKDARFTLASTALRSMSDAYLSDDIHYGQTALNMVGQAAGGVAAVN
ncbi:MAG: hypothetical protein J5518_01365 [Lachnospiraceae bacterium]|nr:hypothetical protein [Lachnospiraceae bacterium]